MFVVGIGGFFFVWVIVWSCGGYGECEDGNKWENDGFDFYEMSWVLVGEMLVCCGCFVCECLFGGFVIEGIKD